jgi:lysozyme family protein
MTNPYEGAGPYVRGHAPVTPTAPPPNYGNVAVDRFKVCLKHVLKWEGGYTDDPHDPGGKTMKGVLQRVYDRYRDQMGRPRRWVKQIAEDELQDIYRRYYWDPLKADELPTGVDLAVFDFGVNCGIGTAAKHLQAVVGVDRDGHIGPVTIGAAHAMDADTLIKKLHARRDHRYRQLHHFWRFGKGWLNRSRDIKAIAANMTLDIDKPMPDAGAGDMVAATDAVHDAQHSRDSKMARATETERTSTTQSTEVRTAAAGSVVGGGITVDGLANAAAKTAASDSPGLMTFAWSLMADPQLWVGLAVVIGSIYLALRRMRHIWADPMPAGGAS